jgi:Zn finger protein HypA/HybF involved in hydrogenase expression
VEIPPVRVEVIRRQPLRLPPGELWCASCGFDMPAPKFYEDEPDGVCPSCHQRTLVPATAVLKTDEYFVAH